MDVCHGANQYGFDTVVVCQKGREKTYAKYYKKRDDGMGGEKGCVGNIILVDKFEDVLKESVQKELRALNTIFVHNRYFWVYFKDFSKVEKDFRVPILGLREGVKLEERDVKKNQYYLLEKADIRMPKILREGGGKVSNVQRRGEKEKLEKILVQHFKNGGGPLIVKANEALRGYERAFFIINDAASYFAVGREKVKKREITQEGLDNAVIEEYVIGAHINLNFFYSPLSGELELLGTDTRRQTNLDGFLRLDADTQRQLGSGMITMVETGHYAVTMKESLIEKAYELGEKFVKTMKKEVSPGIRGPFALQGAVESKAGKEEFVIFDVSMRIPGSPGTKFTPYSGYLYGESMSYGERIAMEIGRAVEEDRMDEIVT